MFLLNRIRDSFNRASNEPTVSNHIEIPDKIDATNVDLIIINTLNDLIDQVEISIMDHDSEENKLNLEQLLASSKEEIGIK